jgi:hypothetical protein
MMATNLLELSQGSFNIHAKSSPSMADFNWYFKPTTLSKISVSMPNTQQVKYQFLLPYLSCFSVSKSIFFSKKSHVHVKMDIAFRKILACATLVGQGHNAM